MTNIGERRFGRLLKQRAIRFWRESSLHRKIEVKGKRPDYYAEPSGFPPFLAEVKDFMEPGPFRVARSRVQTVGQDENAKRLRACVRAAAAQLRPYQDLGIPMLVILDNAGKVGIFLAPIDLIELWGIPGWQVPIDVTTGDQTAPASVHHGSKQVFTPSTTRYVSAVAVNLPKEGYQYVTPVEKVRPMRLRVVHNPYALVPLSPQVFTDGEDEHIGFKRGWWVNLQTGRSIFSR